MRTEMVVTLAHGLALEGELQRDAVVRSLTGADEAACLDTSVARTAAALGTALIVAATRNIGRLEPITPDVARSLTVGDRERLLLAIHRATLGDRIDAVVRCQRETCAETMDVDLSIDRLFELADAPPVSDMAADAVYEQTVMVHAASWTVQFRLPNGGDQEHAATLAMVDVRRGADAVLTRAVHSVARTMGEIIAIDRWLPVLREPLGARFSALDMYAEIRVAVSCPTCGDQTEATLDAAAFLLAGFRNRSSLIVDVHRLARAYHWSEAEILALPVSRRRQYLDLIAGDGVPA